MSLINIGMSGLNAAQGSLSTLSNNIANANTSGYSRQQTTQVSNASQQFGGVFIGSGTTLADVRRVYNEFLDTQLQNSTALSSDAKAYLDQIGSIDKMLSDKSTGIGTALNSFFSAMQTSSANPNDMSARQLLLTSAQTLSNRFNAISGQLNQQNDNVNSQLTNLTGQANQLTKSIADLNKQINQASGPGGVGAPANLLDARNEAVRSLNELVGVKVTERDGIYNVTTGTGQPLVMGDVASTLSAVPSKDDKSQYGIQLTNGTSKMDMSSVISGGAIGGLLRYRSDVLMPAMSDLGRTALVVADAINSQLGQGLDANGQFGASLFGDINSAIAITQRSLGASGNSAGSGNLNVTITDTSKLSTFGYKVTFSSDKDYTVLRSDGKSMGPFDITAKPPEIDGFTLALDGRGPVGAGDSFVVSPTRTGASNITTQLTDANKLAYAGPLVGSAGKSNGGTGALSAPTLSKRLDIHGGADTAQLETAISQAKDIKLVFSKPAADGTQAYTVTDAQGTEIGKGTIVPGQDNKITIDVPMRDADGNVLTGADGKPRTFGVDTTISGAPAANDSFGITFNSAGKSDNRNAKELLNLQTKSTVGVSDGNTGVSMITAYSSLVSFVGGKASQAGVDNTATSAVLSQAKNSRNSVSSVNLDDEAGDMIKFQQYYTASSQIIKAAQETFSTLINSL